MAGESWGAKTIGSLIQNGTIVAHKDGNYGSSYPRVHEFGDEGVPFLTAKLLDDSGHIDFDHAPRLSTKKADKLRFGFIESGDVLLSHNATVGRVAVVPDLVERVLVGTSLTYFRLDKNRLLPWYLAAYMTGREFQNQLKAAMSHSTRNQVPITAQRELSVVVPPLTEQREIAERLGNIQDKISLNRRMNQTLEAIARAIFKSWFVDFDPVRAKAEGREPAGMDHEAAALFPDSFQDSPLGKIPKGWEVGCLGDIAVRRHQTIKPEEMGEGTPYVALDDVPRRSIALYQWKTAEGIASAKNCFRKGDVLFGKLRPYFHKVVVAPVDGICSTDIIVVSAKDEALSNLVLMTCSGTDFVAHNTAVMTGTKMPRTNWKDMRSYELLVPTDEIAAAYQAITQPLIDQLLGGVKENLRSAGVRDLLLPRLIAGEIKGGP